MMTNSCSIINPGRICRLMNKYMIENWRTLAISLCGLLAIAIASGIYVAVNSFDEQYCNLYSYTKFEPPFILTLFFGGAYIASTSFRQLSTPTDALSLLTIPASHFEKFLIRWLVAVPMFLLVMLVSLWIADTTRLTYSFLCYGVELQSIPWSKIIANSVATDYRLDNNIHWTLFYFTMQSFFLLGSVIWRRNAFIKTVVAQGVISTACGLCAYWILDTFLPENPTFDLPAYLNEKCLDYVMIFSIIANYALTYFRLRESEIINRW